MIRSLLRVLTGLAGLLALLLAARLWIDPAGPAAQLGLSGEGRLGAATLRADVAGFFAAAGAFALAGAVRSDPRLLTPPLVLLSLALAGRALTVALQGWSADLAAPMGIEVVLVLILLLTRSQLRRR